MAPSMVRKGPLKSVPGQSVTFQVTRWAKKAPDFPAMESMAQSVLKRVFFREAFESTLLITFLSTLSLSDFLSRYAWLLLL